MTDERNTNTSGGEMGHFLPFWEKNGSRGAGKSFCGSVVDHAEHIRIKLLARCDAAALRGC